LFLAPTHEDEPRARKRAAYVSVLVAGADSLVRVPEDASVALVPLGTPFLAGPGAIVATIVLTRQHSAFTQRLAMVAGAVVALLVVLAALSFASTLARLLRPSAIHFLTRITGLLLTAIAVELVADAVQRWVRSALGEGDGAFDAPTRKCMNAAGSGQVSATRRVYFLGFRTFTGATDGSVWYYDTASRTYTDTGIDMPVPVSNYGIAALNDATGLGFYIFGRRDANANIVTTVQVYYPATNTTAVITSDPWPGKTPSGCVSLPAMGVAAMGNKAFILGGASFSANGCLDENSAQTWIFDPMAPAGSRWTQGGNLAVASGYITPAVLGGKVYAIGGDLNIGGAFSLNRRSKPRQTAARGMTQGSPTSSRPVTSPRRSGSVPALSPTPSSWPDVGSGPTLSPTFCSTTRSPTPGHRRGPSMRTVVTTRGLARTRWPVGHVHPRRLQRGILVHRSDPDERGRPGHHSAHRGRGVLRAPGFAP